MIYFVIPAFNEEANIGKLFESLDAHCRHENLLYHVIVVDDGSSDRTAEIVRQKTAAFPCSLISYSPNRGVDEAFRRGLNRALEVAGPEDVIVTSEADGTADLCILKDFLEKIKNGRDIVVASYYAEGGAVESTALYRKILSRAANFFISALFRIRGIHTFSSFYRAHRPSALKAVKERYGDFFTEKGFSCVVELLIRAHRLKLRLDEVPMVLQGGARAGKSKMKVSRTIIGYLRIGGRLVTRSI